MALAAPAEVGKEHERAPLLLDLAQKVALGARDKADSLRGHLDNGEVVVLVVVVDGDRPDALRHHALDVLLGAVALVLTAANLERERVLEEV